ncbi:MAG: GNAT family N-acetyltransferase [Actinomycetia bacterium]|nr:GNAT family N-acetyltransferase [Actinomycetes bacterium]
MTDVVLCKTAEVSPSHLAATRQMLDQAFDGDFADTDWEHGLGGTHAMIVEGEQVLAHASVVARTIIVGTRSVRVGYVESVGVAPTRQRLGLGSAVMRAIDEVITEQFELGMLGTGEFDFYERLGWERWHGSTWTVRDDGRREPTPDDDGLIMVFRTGHLSDLDPTLPITCEDRAGDCW